jgi:hypothetical protein
MELFLSSFAAETQSGCHAFTISKLDDNTCGDCDNAEFANEFSTGSTSFQCQCRG